MGSFSFLYTTSKKLNEFWQRDSMILDVRSKSEFQNGAISGSHNIPLNELRERISEIKNWNRPVITCCVIGVKSEKAASILKKQGIESINGGGWVSLSKKLKK